jgi:hypothetical protein
MDKDRSKGIKEKYLIKNKNRELSHILKLGI